MQIQFQIIRVFIKRLSLNFRNLDFKITIKPIVDVQNVGHRVPTGFIDRQLILVVHALDEQNNRVELSRGLRLPKSAGKWSGYAGALYAKQLVGENNRTPSPFWLPVFDVTDSRLKPEQPDVRTFVFAKGARRVSVQLWYRRFWQEVADARGWLDNDLLVQEMHLAWD